MDDWRNAIDNYQTSSNSLIQNTLSTNESLLRSKADITQASISSKIQQRGQDFANTSSLAQQKIMETIGTDLSANALKEPVLKGLQYVAQKRANYLTRRANISEPERLTFTAQGMDEEGNLPDEIPEDREGESQAASEVPPPPPPQEPEPQVRPTLEQADSLSGIEGDATPAGRVTRAFRATAEPDAPVSLTGRTGGSDSMLSDADAFSGPRSLGQTITSSVDNIEEGVGNSLADTAESAAKIAGSLADTAGASSWSSLADSIGEAIPYVGTGLAIWGLVSGAKGLVDEAKAAASDPYAALRGKINKANNQIDTMTANISSDQFQSKIGAAAPRFGSIAAMPDMQSKEQTGGVALHI